MNSTITCSIRVRDTSPSIVRRFVIVAALLLSSCTSTPVIDDRPAIRIGAGADTESQLIAEIMVVAFAQANLPAEVRTLSGNVAARRALLDNRIDIRVAYTGESWLDVLARPDPPSSPRDSFTAVRDFDQNLPVIWLTPPFGTGFSEPPANATFALVIDPNSELGPLDTMSQLASVLSVNPEAALCVDDEFRERPDGLRSLLAVYSVRSNQPVIPATPQEAVLAVAAGECVAGLTTTTDGTAWLLGLRPLRDDLGVFPAFIVVFQMRADLEQRIPEVTAILAPLTSGLTTETLGQLNARIVAGESLRDTAQDALVILTEQSGS
ncbi:MAG: glycine betaine ABC transporter substrate-binding protein [Nitriliruptoraceae bacterium]